jgi:hypothetical protein
MDDGMRLSSRHASGSHRVTVPGANHPTIARDANQPSSPRVGPVQGTSTGAGEGTASSPLDADALMKIDLTSDQENEDDGSSKVSTVVRSWSIS